MNLLSSSHILSYLYWVLLLLVTSGALVSAILAFKLQKQVYAIVSAGALAAGLLLAAMPTPNGQSAFIVLLGMLGLALAVVGGAPMAVLALKLSTKNSVPQGTHGGIMVENEGEPAPTETLAAPAVHEVLRGGLTIGILERLATAGAILAGFPEALAIVVAIKGVGRFTELAAAEARERFIIGTFASLIWACACAALVRLAAS